jgi:hypothetical protein
MEETEGMEEIKKQNQWLPLVPAFSPRFSQTSICFNYLFDHHVYCSAPQLDVPTASFHALSVQQMYSTVSFLPPGVKMVVL